MAVLSDNSDKKSLKGLSNHIGEGIVVDIGTGDGRFVSAAARANPHKFYIGIDANVKPLEKPSMKATRKPKKGGLPNALFVQASADYLPEELNGTADEIHIHFPWGSLLQAVCLGDSDVLSGLHLISAPGCLLEIVVGVDSVRDRSELESLGIPDLSPVFIHSYLIPKYRSAGFLPVEYRKLRLDQWRKLETSWARRLQDSPDRSVTHLIFQAT